MPLFLFLVPFNISCDKKAPRVQTATEGSPAPDFSVTAFSGEKMKLSDLGGKVVLVNFWATWCASCAEEKPHLFSLYSRLKDNPDFRFVSILFRDDINKALMFQKAHSMAFPVYLDPGGEAAFSYGLTGVPETFIIDKQGILRKKIIGPENWASPQVLAYFRDLLEDRNDLSAENNKNFEACRQKLVLAQKSNVLYDLDWKLPAEPRVVIGPTFYTMPFDAKENFALTINCFLMTGKSSYVNFDLLDWQTNKKIGRFSNGKLKLD